RPEGDVTFSVLADRVRFAPQGLAGGGPAQAARLVQNPDSMPRDFSSKMSVALTGGEVFSVQMAGGGGYGQPWERDPALVLEDVLAGRVSVERARTVYGVAVADGAVDESGTGRLRIELAVTARESQAEGAQ